MSSDEFAIRIQGLSKYFQIYETPGDRLKQFVVPRLQRMLRLPPKQYFQEFGALKDVSFELKKGETVGVIGRNGSGKSTLLQIICGTLTPTGGSVETQGRIAALLELGSGFNPEFTGHENIYMYASVLGLTDEEITSRYDAIIAFADIDSFIYQPIKTYSSGMVVRLAFAVIAHVDADILVIDEALSVGDAFFVQKCMRFLRSFMQTGTVLFVSHDTGAVLNLCQRALLLESGKLILQGEPKEVTESYLEKIYESQQGETVIAKNQAQDNANLIENDTQPRDMRLDFINQSNLRNDIELFLFEPDATSFGKGSAKIEGVYLLDKQDRVLSWVVGGERVALVVKCIAVKELFSVIVGFQVKDRLGQVVFGDNTYLTYEGRPVNVTAENSFRAIFEFEMPILPVGNYTVGVAIAEGTQLNHIQQHWVHDAISFKVHSSHICLGLVGVPITKIEITIE